MSKFAENPYQAKIDLCEELIYFCAKNKKTPEPEDGADAEEEKETAEHDDETEKTR